MARAVEVMAHVAECVECQWWSERIYSTKAGAAARARQHEREDHPATPAAVMELADAVEMGWSVSIPRLGMKAAVRRELERRQELRKEPTAMDGQQDDGRMPIGKETAERLLANGWTQEKLDEQFVVDDNLVDIERAARQARINRMRKPAPPMNRAQRRAAERKKR